MRLLSAVPATTCFDLIAVHSGRERLRGRIWPDESKGPREGFSEVSFFSEKADVKVRLSRTRVNELLLVETRRLLEQQEDISIDPCI